MALKKIAVISLISLISCRDNEPAIAPNDFEGFFEKVWNDFDQTYSYFEIKGLDWDSVYNVNRPKIVNGQTTSAELADILVQMTLSLRDLHVRFTSEGTIHQYKNRNYFAANSPENYPTQSHSQRTLSLKARNGCSLKILHCIHIQVPDFMSWEYQMPMLYITKTRDCKYPQSPLQVNLSRLKGM